jgi:hypothetical protein
MSIETKSLTLRMIDNCLEIQNWLSQFKSSDLNTVKSLLMHLKFISRDEYASWLINKLGNYTSSTCAVYAVRKFNMQAKYLWRANGSVQPRPSQTQGSEDLVASVIVNANRVHNNCFIDHPSLNVLREKRIRDIILIDDSIGSGKRVADFINLMTNHRTFLSWWSYGFITIHILSYARTRQSEELIVNRLPGSDRGVRKYRKSSKIKFDSDVVYDANDIAYRWGENSQAIIRLLDSIKKINKDRRIGFGNVMGNLIFYHSVPNNIPGIIFASSNSWNPLFPKRATPEWMVKLLEGSYFEQVKNLNNNDYKVRISSEVKLLLQNVKKGIRTKASLSRRMDIDILIVFELINQAVEAGFITRQLRLTKTGSDFLHKQKVDSCTLIPNYSLYVPKSWCAGHGTIQPPVQDIANTLVQADSIDLLSIDGDDGELSLERTDAMATKSPNNSITN